MSRRPTSRKKAMYTSRRIRTLPSYLELGQPIDAGAEIAKLAGLGLQFERDGQSPRGFSDSFERIGKLVQQQMALVGSGRRRLRSTLQPLDGFRHHVALAVQATNQGRRLEPMAGRLRCDLKRLNALLDLPSPPQRQATLQLFLGGIGRPSPRAFFAKTLE